MSKRQAYYKGVKKVRQDKEWKKEQVTRDGFHMWLPGIEVGRPQFQQFRHFLLKREGMNFDEFYGGENLELGYWVDRKEIFDKALFDRNNGLMIMGQKKPRVGTAHEIFYWTELKDVQNPYKATKITEEQRISAYRKCYSFLFKPTKLIPPVTPAKPKATQPKPPPVRKVAEPKRSTKKPETNFNLDAFLSAVRSVDFASYKTAIAYFAQLGLDHGKPEKHATQRGTQKTRKRRRS